MAEESLERQGDAEGDSMRRGCPNCRSTWSSRHCTEVSLHLIIVGLDSNRTLFQQPRRQKPGHFAAGTFDPAGAVLSRSGHFSTD